MSNIYFPPDKWYDDDSKLVFLAGPIIDSNDWQNDAIEFLRPLIIDEKISVANPRKKMLQTYDDETYFHQISWETYHIRAASANGAIIFWIPKCEYRVDERYMIELAEWLTHVKYRINSQPENLIRLVIGIEPDAKEEDYIKLRISQDMPGFPVFSSLQEVCEIAINSFKMKICRDCKINQSFNNYYLKKNGKPHSNRCKICQSKHDYERIKNNPIQKQKKEILDKKYKEKISTDRKNNKNRELFILKDSKSFDRTHGFENNLTLNMIKSLISKPCSYCGGDDLPMSLDRIDNSKGHLINNIIVSCRRCNFIRRDMPFEAWKYLCDGLKQAREHKAFGDWIGGNTKRKI